MKHQKRTKPSEFPKPAQNALLTWLKRESSVSGTPPRPDVSTDANDEQTDAGQLG